MDAKLQLTILVSSFLSDTPTVSPATSWQLCQWCCDQSSFRLIDVTDLAMVDSLLQNAPNRVVNRIEVRAVWWSILWTDEDGCLSIWWAIVLSCWNVTNVTRYDESDVWRAEYSKQVMRRPSVHSATEVFWHSGALQIGLLLLL